MPIHVQLLLFFFSAFIATNVFAKEKSPDGDCIMREQGSERSAIGSGTIGKIFICTGNVFDLSKEGEDGLLYRAANFLHIKTRHKYIEEQLLFSPGDVLNQQRLEESERKIRANNYISEAEITTRKNAIRPEKTDVIVRTRDSWTTKPTLSLSRSGGETTSSIGVREDNLLGQGVRLSVKRKIDIDRNSTEFKFQDDTVISSDKSLYLEYANNSDGDIKAMHLNKPYESLNDRITYGLFYRYEKLTAVYYVLGEQSLSFDKLNEHSDIYMGISTGLHDGHTIRHQFGMQSFKSGVENIAIDADMPSALSVLKVIETNTHAPYYQYQLIEDRFKKAMNVYSIGRVEDINLGLELRARVGIASSLFDSDDEQLIHQLEIQKRFQIFGDADLIFRASADVLIDRDSANHVRTNLAMDYFKNQSRNFKFFSSLSAENGHSLRNGEQVYLDNLRGLRGYPVYHLSGTESVLFTIEERVYFDKVLWNIINIGAAVFVDVGNISGEEQLDALDRDYFRSMGIGLRLGSNRSSSANIMHIDFAKPMDAHSGSRSFQIAIEVKDRF